MRTLAVVFLGAALTSAQGLPSFDVASVKPNTSGDPGRGTVMLQPGGGFRASNASLRILLTAAFHERAFEPPLDIVGAPEWIDSSRFDIAAKAAENHVLDPDGTPRRSWLMVRALLMDRFKVRAHRETREAPVYALVVARADGRLGPAISQSTVDCRTVLEEMAKGIKPKMEPGKGPLCSVGGPPGRLTINALPMAMFADVLSGQVGRAVVDRTGLQGSYDVQLEFSEHPLEPGTAPSIFTALQEQLGLKLEPASGPVDILVIDHVERPTPD